MTGAKPAVTSPVAAVQPLDLPRDEMAFRAGYESLLVDKSLTTVFRPGDRRWPKWRGYRPGEIVTARVIAKCGSDALGIPPVFTDQRTRIQILTIDVLDPGRLTADDFSGSSPDVHDQTSLRAHLLDIYGEPLEARGGVVTRIRFAYVDGQ
ncbi:hypothetical protein [Sphingomonas sp. 28-63-12]|uniref:hypothetical protein n=1 Tax=Sphingomonas sp. 28-63-12 TaxID=1970434 RepID=UPI000BD24C05|nr:MAG: hypothetical protein B7Y47_02575 [Sphingomonas sp. 28-63-12]